VVTHTRDGQLTDISEKTPAGTYRVVFNADGTVREDKTGLWSDGRRERGLGQDEVNALIQKSGFQFDR
jgi:hypothetical protein